MYPQVPGQQPVQFPESDYPPPYLPGQRSRRPRRRRPVRDRRIFLPDWRMPQLKPGCVSLLLAAAGIGLIGFVYLFFPLRSRLLILGIDYTDPGNALARSDTIILATFNPNLLRPHVRTLSVPRDLWVAIPGLGENRINTAHFYAEGHSPGSGPQALLQTIALNFDLEIPYYLRIRFEGFRDVVNALGGVDIELSAPAAGYPAGKHHLTGRKALAFVRNRTGTDDFFRMENAQLMMKALLKNMLNPLKWPRLPAVARAFFAAIDTNAPFWLWPRLAAALLRVGPYGIESHIIPRQMTTPFTTDQGANVLIPDWTLIHLLVKQLFNP